MFDGMVVFIVGFAFCLRCEPRLGGAHVRRKDKRLGLEIVEL